MVLVHAQFPARNLNELIATARAKKDAVSCACSGNGSAQHVAGALFEAAARVEMLHIPYKGGGPALNDLLAGHVPLFCGTPQQGRRAASCSSSPGPGRAARFLPLPVLPDQPARMTMAGHAPPMDGRRPYPLRQATVDNMGILSDTTPMSACT